MSSRFEKEIRIIDQRRSQNNSGVREIIRNITADNPEKFETLRKAYYRSKKPQEHQHGNQKFSDAEEKRLCSIILAFAASGMALSRTMFISLVRKIFKLEDDWSGSHWFTGFVSRHADVVALAFGKDLDIGRVNSVNSDVIDLFMRVYKRLLDENNYQDDFIINADESP